MLTKKQRELLIYIQKHMAGQDIAPSFEEMKLALGLKSKSGIHRLISSLVERGYLRRLPHRARALEIARMPDGSAPRGGGNAAASPSPAIPFRAPSPEPAFSNIPLYGKIAAGTPIEAVRDEGHILAVPADLMARSGDHYALHVEGDSMINAGIHDGDTVIIRRCDDAENGTIIVALVDGEEVTLKRLRRAGAQIILESENDAHAPRVLEAARVKIQGRLAGLMRTYH